MKSKSLKFHIFATLLVTFLSVGSFVSITYLTKFLTDATIAKQTIDFLIYFGIVLGLVIFSGIMMGLQNRLSKVTSRMLAARIKEQKIESLDHVNHDADLIRNDLLVKAESVSVNYYQNMFAIFGYLIRLLFSVAFAFAMSWVVGVAAVISSTLLLLFAQIKNKNANKLQSNINNANELFSKTIAKNIGGYMYFRFANKEKYIANVFDNANLQMKNSSTRFAVFSVTKSSAFNLILNLISFSINLAAGISILYYNADYGIFVAAIALSYHSINSANDLGQNIAEKNSMKQVLKDFTTAHPLLNPISQIKGDIKINNISIAFDQNQVFNNFSLQIKEFSKTLIIGQSGKGKSTLMRVMNGDLKPSEGKIHFGNQLIDTKIVSDNLKVMTNDFTFDVENIDNAITSFSKEIQVDVLKELKTKLGIEEVNPITASRGELQKIKIANMLYSGCDYQFYDEPFSNISKDSLKNVINLIIKQKNKTVVVIAHNLPRDIISKFDQVIRL